MTAKPTEHRLSVDWNYSLGCRISGEAVFHEVAPGRLRFIRIDSTCGPMNYSRRCAIFRDGAAAVAGIERIAERRIFEGAA